MADERGRDGDDGSTEEPPPGLRWWQLVVMWAIALGAPAGIFSVGLHRITAGLSDTLGPDECEGIGFGCSLSERDGVELLARVYGVPIVALLTAVCGMVAGSITARSRWSEVRWLVLVAVLVIVVLTVTDPI